MRRTLQGRRRRYGVYARLSQDRTGAGLAVAAQVVDCRALADRRGDWDFVEAYEDNDVGAFRRTKRKNYLRMLEDIRERRIDAVVIWHIDRLTRQPAELEEFISLCDEYGVELATVTGDVNLGTPMGRLLARQLGAHARYEIEHRSERQRSANRRRADAGEPWTGGMRCYGYDETGKLVVEDEAAVIRDIATRMLAGEKIRSLVADLRARQVLTTAGKPFTHQTLTRLMRNPRLAGFRTYDGEIVGKGDWDAILKELQHKQLVELLGDPDRRTSEPTNVRRYLLTGGLLICGAVLDEGKPSQRVCGKPLGSQPSNSGKRGYVCRKSASEDGCGKIRIAAETLEEFIVGRALARLASPKIRAKIEAQMAGLAEADDSVLEQLAVLDTREKELGASFADGDITRVTLKGAQEKLRQERRAITDRVDRRHRLMALPELTIDSLNRWWRGAPLERQRELVQVVLRHAVISKSTRRGYIHLDTDRVHIVWV